MKNRGGLISQGTKISGENISSDPTAAGLHKKDGRRLERTPRVLVAIASFGGKNLRFLEKIIAGYRNMAMDVDLVVQSDGPKNLHDSVKVGVGLPSRNPHSLPFAHKRVFADNVDRYDLFIYTEDDIEITEQNIRLFMEVNMNLESDEIAGFLRYEVGDDEQISLPDVHGQFHWKPESVGRRGSEIVAQFTNEHAGFYILTRAQLQRAIASGGFLREPYEGRYSMLETGATDPYTSCGFRKVICISRLDQFLIHHMPNRYAGVLGVPLESFNEQIQTLVDICHNIHPASTLCDVESRLLHNAWSKEHYEKPCDEILAMVPDDAKTVLSIGCGSGAIEAKLQKRGTEVTALPLDSVIGAVAARRGVEMIYGTLTEGLEILKGRRFGCVTMTNLLHLLADPWSVLEECAKFVRKGGTMVIAGPNFYSIPVLVRRAVRLSDYAKLRSFAESGIHAFRIASLIRQMKRAGLDLCAVRWFDSTPPCNLIGLRRRCGRFMAKDWVVRAERAV